jgi:hypothetical protein
MDYIEAPGTCAIAVSKYFTKGTSEFAPDSREHGHSAYFVLYLYENKLLSNEPTCGFKTWHSKCSKQVKREIGG